MATPRADGPLLEQPGRLRAVLIALTALAAVVLAAVVLMIPPKREHVRGHAYAIPSPERRVTVEVLNGTRRAGTARVATRMLRRQGLDVVFFGNADGPADSTRVIVRRGDPGRGRDVRAALGVGRIVVEPDTLRRVDVSVVLGQDFRPRGELRP
ncbi:MAG TPA: LytR C-terminal domain-containing protein [Gemmatimonadales bacterium]|nr:LytR C-terminal domain-containing protein [Gemmatimonadales bacterium]